MGDMHCNRTILEMAQTTRSNNIASLPSSKATSATLAPNHTSPIFLQPSAIEDKDTFSLTSLLPLPVGTPAFSGDVLAFHCT